MSELAARFGDSIGAHNSGGGAGGGTSQTLGNTAGWGTVLGAVGGAILIGAAIVAAPVVLSIAGALLIGGAISMGLAAVGIGLQYDSDKKARTTAEAAAAASVKAAMAAAGGPGGKVGAGCSTISTHSPNVWIEGQQAARVGDTNVHRPSSPTIATGAETVVVNGRPLARKGEKSTCGGIVISTAKRTWIGGPSSPSASAAAANAAAAAAAPAASAGEAPGMFASFLNTMVGVFDRDRWGRALSGDVQSTIELLNGTSAIVGVATGAGGARAMGTQVLTRTMGAAAVTTGRATAVGAVATGAIIGATIPTMHYASEGAGWAAEHMGFAQENVNLTKGLVGFVPGAIPFAAGARSARAARAARRPLPLGDGMELLAPGDKRGANARDITPRAAPRALPAPSAGKAPNTAPAAPAPSVPACASGGAGAKANGKSPRFAELDAKLKSKDAMTPSEVKEWRELHFKEVLEPKKTLTAGKELQEWRSMKEQQAKQAKDAEATAAKPKPAAKDPDSLTPTQRATFEQRKAKLETLSKRSGDDPMGAAKDAEGLVGEMGLPITRSKEVNVASTGTINRKAAELRKSDPSLSEAASIRAAAEAYDAKGMYGFDPKSNSVVLPKEFTIAERAPDLSNPAELALAQKHSRATIEEATHALNYNTREGGEFVPLHDNVRQFSDFVDTPQGAAWLKERGLQIDTRNGVPEKMPHEIDIMELHQRNGAFSQAEVGRYDIRKAFQQWKTEGDQASATGSANEHASTPREIQARQATAQQDRQWGLRENGEERPMQPQQQQQQQANAGGGNPPLNRLHSDATTTNSASYSHWRSRPTDEIVKSLKPGAEEPLRVDSRGKVWDGNTRVKVLEERGYDANRLPRERYQRSELDALGEPRGARVPPADGPNDAGASASCSTCSAGSASPASRIANAAKSLSTAPPRDPAAVVAAKAATAKAALNDSIKSFVATRGAGARPLTQSELMDLVTHLGTNDRKLIKDLTANYSDKTAYPERPAVFLGDPASGPSIWLLGWRDGDYTPIHDHGDSRAAVHVWKGPLEETVYNPNTLELATERSVPEGKTVPIPAPYIHVMGNSGKVTPEAISIHAYDPPLKMMDYYEPVDGKAKFSGRWEDDEIVLAREQQAREEGKQ